MNKEQMKFATWIADEFPELGLSQVADVASDVIRVSRAFHRQYQLIFDSGRADTDDTDILEDKFAKQLTAIFQQYTNRKVGWVLGGDYRGCIVRMVVPSGKESYLGAGGVTVPYAVER